MTSTYERLGDKLLQKMVDKFYDLVVKDDRLNHLFTTDMDLVKRKQFAFLSQFLGGPPRYMEEFGHPMMRARHMPHKITEDAAVAWLECMAFAINDLPIDPEFKKEIYARFPRTAAHMVNSK